MSFGLTRIEFEEGPATREAFGEALAEAGSDQRVVVVDGDVNNSTYTNHFKEKYPERFFNAGIAESNMVGIASGLSATGKIPVVSSFSTFLMSNAFDQIRMSVAFPNQNVKLVGTHAGISIGEDGPSQMAIEDVALACALPGFTVVVPADGPSTKLATKALIERPGPAYLRCGRPKVPLLYTDPSKFHIGKATTMRDGDDVTIIANGIMVAMALDAAEGLRKKGSRLAFSTCTRSSRSMRPRSKRQRTKREGSSWPRSTWRTVAWARWSRSSRPNAVRRGWHSSTSATPTRLWGPRISCWSNTG